jgi:hypothetical protein
MSDPYGDDSTSSTFVVDSGSKAAIEERLVHSADTSSEARCVKGPLAIDKLLRSGYALEVAAFWADERVVKILLENGADVNIKSKYYGTILTAAVQRGRFLNCESKYSAIGWRRCTGVERMLLDHGAVVDKRAMRAAKRRQAMKRLSRC